MASFKELRRLRDEERTLVHIASKINDQLNRLKVEELALLSAIRMDEKGEKTEGDNAAVKQNEDAAIEIIGEEEESDMDQTKAKLKQTPLPDIDLTVSQNTEDTVCEEEEEEDDDDELNQMMTELQE